MRGAEIIAHHTVQMPSVLSLRADIQTDHRFRKIRRQKSDPAIGLQNPNRHTIPRLRRMTAKFFRENRPRIRSNSGSRAADGNDQSEILRQDYGFRPYRSFSGTISSIRLSSFFLVLKNCPSE